MNDREIDDILNKAAGAGPGVDAALVERISKSIGAGLQPANALPAASLVAGGMVLTCAVVAMAVALGLGLYGIRKMDATQAASIFALLVVLFFAVARLCVSEAVPGSRRLMAPWVSMLAICVAPAILFAALFQNYGTQHFVTEGVRCLSAGLATAIPAAALVWMMLRRGFAVDSVASGMARGALAGLAGLAMLELHCKVFDAPHILVWHNAVVAASGALGAAAGRVFQAGPRRRDASGR